MCLSRWSIRTDLTHLGCRVTTKNGLMTREHACHRDISGSTRGQKFTGILRPDETVLTSADDFFGDLFRLTLCEKLVRSHQVPERAGLQLPTLHPSYFNNGLSLCE